MFFKIKSIEILPDFIIRAGFENNVIKTYNFNPLFSKYPVFEPLKQKSFFNQAVVDCSGYGIKWNDDIDIDAAEIWYNGATDLNSEQDIVNYLNAVVNEPDTKLFIKALDDIAKSKGVCSLAKKMEVNRESLYKSLNGESEPKFKTIDKFLRAIGIGIKFAPISTIVSTNESH